ncbi:hypothetical protein IU427_33830 [Nocardia beijingensis]|nr:hypothetical protein [Nocardia beijingensis]
MHEQVLSELHAAGRPELPNALVGSSRLQALKGGNTPVPARSTGASPAPSTT